MNPLRTACCCACVAFVVQARPASADKVKQIVRISASEAQARGMYEIGLSIDLGASGLTPTKFPAKDLYLAVSGPPGGPLGLELRKGSMFKDSRPLPGTFHPKANAKIRVGKRRLDASAYTEGKSLARRHGCVVGLRAPRGRHGLLILRFWSGSGETEHPGCAALARRRPFLTILPSIRLSTK